jgi:hydroxymethylglutaryl-CoA lyase
MTQQKRSILARLVKALGPFHRAEASSSVARVLGVADLKQIARTNAKERKAQPENYPQVGYLIFNEKGAENVLKFDPQADEISMTVSADRRYQKSNTGREDPHEFIENKIGPALSKVRQLAAESHQPTPRLRGYISCVWGYLRADDQVPVSELAALIKEMHDQGVTEFALSDTTGLATPDTIRARIQELLNNEVIRQLPADVEFAIHLHDNGMGILNVLAALQNPRISIVDTALANLGGSPFASGAHGNISTEDLVFVLSALGVETGINLDELLEATSEIESMAKEDLLAPGSNRRVMGLHRLTKAQVDILRQELQQDLLGPPSDSTYSILGGIISWFLSGYQALFKKRPWQFYSPLQTLKMLTIAA